MKFEKIKTRKELNTLYRLQLDTKTYNTLVKAAKKLNSYANANNIRCEMAGYGGYDELVQSEIVDHICDTSACGIGLISMLYPVKAEYFDWCGQYDYQLFQEDKIPVLYPDRGSIYKEWLYLFSGAWQNYQNTYDLFLERLNIYLSGRYDKDWIYKKEN